MDFQSILTVRRDFGFVPAGGSGCDAHKDFQSILAVRAGGSVGGSTACSLAVIGRTDDAEGGRVLLPTGDADGSRFTLARRGEVPICSALGGVCMFRCFSGARSGVRGGALQSITFR